MHIEFTLAWYWLVLLIGTVIYGAGFLFFLIKGTGIKFALIWPLFYLIGGINVQ